MRINDLHHMSTNPSPSILLVDDDPADVDLALEIFDDASGSYRVESVQNGVEALKYLRQEGAYTNASRPDLVLLDLNMPKMDGREVLEELRKDLALCHIPVMVLTTSDDNIDICRSYQLGANGYITKPVGIPEFSSLIEQLEGFWFTHIKQPRTCV